MAILVQTLTGMRRFTEVLVLEKETMMEFLSWTLLLPMICWW